MDILPFVRFEEAYDPFQATPSCDVSSRRSSTCPNLSSDPQNISPLKLDFVVYEDCYCLFVELPGVGPEDLQCTVQQENGCDQLQSVLLIDAATPRTVVPHLKEGFVSYMILERSHHRVNVRRSVVLPLNADTDAAICSLRQGLLTIVVPKRSSSKALTID